MHRWNRSVSIVTSTLPHSTPTGLPSTAMSCEGEGRSGHPPETFLYRWQRRRKWRVCSDGQSGFQGRTCRERGWCTPSCQSKPAASWRRQLSGVQELDLRERARWQGVSLGATHSRHAAVEDKARGSFNFERAHSVWIIIALWRWHAVFKTDDAF